MNVEFCHETLLECYENVEINHSLSFLHTAKTFARKVISVGLMKSNVSRLLWVSFCMLHKIRVISH